MHDIEHYLPLIKRTVDFLLTNADSDAEDAARALMTDGVPEPEALCIAHLTVSAFGRVLIQKLGVRFVDEFRARDRRGKWIAFSYSRSPISQAALSVANETVSSGDRARYRPIADRSVEVRTTNEAVAAGADVNGATFGPFMLLGVAAEDVPAAVRASWFSRMFR